MVKKTVSFGAQVSEWVRKVKAREDAVFRQSVQELFSIAQTTVHQGGDLPLDTGFLRNSFISSLNGSTVTEGPEAYEVVIASAEAGDKIFGGWTAEYALRMEYGFVGTDALGRTYNQSGFGFVANAVTQWQAIVEQNATRLKALSNG